MLRNMLRHAGADVSEPMLFGLGQGIDFQYWDAPEPGRSTPMLTGRIGAGKLARNTCSALDVELRESTPADPESAQAAAAVLLDAGLVVGVTVDIFYLDYFTSKSHFGAHCIALYGLDDTTAYVVDTEQQGGLQQLPVTSLRLARGSDEGFMATPNRQVHLGDLPARLSTDLDALLLGQAWNAMRLTALRMLDDRGPDLGITGLRKAAAEIPGWQDSLEPDVELVPVPGRFWRFAGTGGTNFRGLYLDFLREVRQRSANAGLDPVIEDFEQICRDWDQTIELLIGYPGADDPGAKLAEAGARLNALADAECAAYRRLLDLATAVGGEAA